MTFPPELLAQKYGDRVEDLLSNMFVQDQLLANSSQWSNIVNLGRVVTVRRVEAKDFLTSFDEEAKDSRVERMLHKSTSSIDPYYFKCNYTQARMSKVVSARELQ